MRRGFWWVAGLLLAAVAALPPGAAAQSRLFVTVVDEVGAPVTNLKAENFLITLDKNTRPVSRVEYRPDLVDVVLMIDTSVYTSSGRRDIARIADLLLSQLGEKEQMAIISYATSADLVQDFTSSRSLLQRAVANLRYGNDAAILDSVYAALDSGFQNSAGRRILLILSSGADGHSGVTRNDTLNLAQRNAVSIFSLSLSGYGRNPLEKLAEETAGAYLGGKELRQMDIIARNLFAAFRGHYELTVAGGALDGKLKVEAKRGEGGKLLVSFRPPE